MLVGGLINIDGLPYLGKTATMEKLQNVISSHQAAGCSVGGKKGMNKSGKIKVSGAKNIRLDEFYNVCLEVAVQLGSWKEVSPVTPHPCCCTKPTNSKTCVELKCRALSILSQGVDLILAVDVNSRPDWRGQCFQY